MSSALGKTVAAAVVAYLETHPEIISNLIAWLLPHVIAHVNESPK